MQQVIIFETDFQKARKFIRENKGKKIVFTSYNDDLNRKILEKEPINTLLILQALRKDKMKQRDSGLNQVLAKIAKKKGIAIGICLDEIIDADKSQKAKILARVRQNVRLCNKYKIKMEFLSKEHQRDKYDLKALGLILGMPTWMFN